MIVADSGPIISFARAGRLDILRQVVSELIVPDAVFEEIAVSGKDKPGGKEVQQGAWIKRMKIQDPSLLELTPAKLNLAEWEAILLAKETGGYLLVDELEARKEAFRLGVQ
jgi:predicted nucleic acid-binding protein